METAIPARSQFFKFVRNTVAYKGDQDGEERRPVYADDVAFAAVSENATRRLGSRNIPVVLFTIGASGWFWMLRDEFHKSTEEYDVKGQTSTPFQR